MKKIKKFPSAITGIFITILSFVLLFVADKWILGDSLSFQNILAFSILSMIFGELSGLLIGANSKAAFTLYLVGLLIGFMDMYRLFWSGMGGWGNLMWLITLLSWTALGLGCGFMIQFCLYVYNRISHKRHSTHSKME